MPKTKEDYRLKGRQSLVVGEDKMMLCLRLHAEGWSDAQVAVDTGLAVAECKKICKEEKNLPFIKQFRESYMAKVMDVPIANKRIRLDDLEKSRKKLLKIIDDRDLEKAEERKECCVAIRRLGEVLELAHSEMDKEAMKVFFLMGMENRSDDELMARRDELLNLARISLKDMDANRVGDGAEAGETDDSAVDGAEQSPERTQESKEE